jgi:5-methylcytosine-specific restriction endonuclease McrA
MPVSLRSIPDQEILSRTTALAAQERKLTLSLLLHLNEVERRKLHLKRGYASMFMYCTERLCYSASAANRRIRTARCIARFPEVFALLEVNEVNLSTISQVSKILTPQNRSAVFERIRGKSQREVDAIVAEYEPRAALPPDRVRTVVVPVTCAPDATRTVEPDLLGAHTNEYDRSGGQELASVALVENVGVGKVTTMMSAGADSTAVKLERRAVVQFSAREAVIAKLERVRSIASHRLPANAPLEQLIEFLADHFIEREDPSARHRRREERKQRGQEQAQAPRTGSMTSARHIPAPVRDKVFVRDRGQCTYVSPSGQRCGSSHVLQIDHVQPVTLGGGNTADNLRLLCAHHNRLEAKRLLGRSGPPGQPH